MANIAAGDSYLETYERVTYLQLAFTASAAVLVWEGILTARRLYEVLHGQRWTVTKAAAVWNFVWVRTAHMGVCGATVFATWSDAACRHGTVHSWICMLSALGGQVILLITTHALYDHRRSVLAILLPLLVVSQTFGLVLPIKLQGVAAPPGIPGCLITSVDSVPWAAILFAFSLLFDAVCFTLVLGRWLYFKRSTGGIASPLLTRISRDQAAYFGVVAAFALVNVVMQAVYPLDPRGGILVFPFIVVVTIAANRLVIMFKEDAANGSLAPSIPSAPSKLTTVLTSASGGRRRRSTRPQTADSKLSAASAADSWYSAPGVGRAGVVVSLSIHEQQALERERDRAASSAARIGAEEMAEVDEKSAV